MVTTMVPQQTMNAALITLASAMRLQFADEPAAQRAVDRAVEILDANLPYEFDGTELRVLSFSRSQDGVWHVSDGAGCTCEGNRRPWCRHRAMFRLLMAQWCMTQPFYLRAKIVEQCAPVLDMDVADGQWDEYGDFLQQPRSTVQRPPAGSDGARVQDEADALFA